jgi:dipeptidase
LRRAAPSKNFSPDYHRSKPGAEPYPLCVRPDKKLTAADVFALLRDHYEETESNLLALQPAVEKTALELAGSNTNLAARYLTDYSVMHAELTVERWRALTEHLITKYNDGYIRSEKGEYPDIGYPEPWLRRVIQERPNQFRLPVEQPAPKAANQ